MGRPSRAKKAKREWRQRLDAIDALLPNLPAAIVAELAAVNDPITRYRMLLSRAENIGATDATIGRIQTRLSDAIATQNAGDRAALADVTTPDDSRFRPRHVDSTLRGAARATGQTAAAVRRGTTVTDWQHAERDGAR